MTERIWRLTNRGTFESWAVTRKTAARVYFTTIGGERFVARAELERSGFAHSSVLRSWVYTDEGYRRFLASSPRDTSALSSFGLSSTATAADVKRAYRARAKTVHPDAGGTDAAFMELRRSYERALAAVGAER